jgi:hypothetical protein
MKPGATAAALGAPGGPPSGPPSDPPSSGPRAPSGGPSSLGAHLSPAQLARREAPTARAVLRAQALYVESWDDALLAELVGSEPKAASDVLETVVKSLAHALRAWVAFGHELDAIGHYYKVGPLAEEHDKAVELVERFRKVYESQDAGQGGDT